LGGYSHHPQNELSNHLGLNCSPPKDRTSESDEIKPVVNCCSIFSIFSKGCYTSSDVIPPVGPPGLKDSAPGAQRSSAEFVGGAPGNCDQFFFLAIAIPYVYKIFYMICSIISLSICKWNIIWNIRWLRLMRMIAVQLVSCNTLQQHMIKTGVPSSWLGRC